MNRERALKVVLVWVGLIFLLGVYPLMMFLWPSGWRWQPNQPEYEADDPRRVCHTRYFPTARIA